MNNYLVPTFSLLLLLIIAGTFLYFYFRNLQEDIFRLWFDINQKTRLRLDKIPLLIELMRQSKLASSTNELIELREKTWPLEKPSAEKVKLELSISSKLHELWNEAGKTEDGKNNISMIALYKEITDLGEEIDRLADRYNGEIFKYNTKIDFPLWRPLASLFGFRRWTIFEFEP